MSRWWNPTAVLDATRIGGQSYSGVEVRSVLDVLQHTTYQLPINVGGIALSTGVPGRTVRQIISDMDARVMLIGKRNNGLFVCHYADEAEPYSLALDRHWHAERARVYARRLMERDLPRRQGFLFDPTEYDVEDEDLDL